jgi:hypothetical protein
MSSGSAFSGLPPRSTSNGLIDAIVALWQAPVTNGT